MEENVFKSEEAYVSLSRTGALLKLCVDSTFKALFMQDTKESRAVMYSFGRTEETELMLAYVIKTLS